MEVAGTEELEVTSNLDITVNGPEGITAIDPTDTEVQVVKRAYTVVGDNVYVPSGSYDDAPDWVKILVQNAVNFEIDARDTNLLTNVDSILSLFENGYVPKNQYDNYVIQQQTAYDSLTTRVDSLDATVQTNETDVNAKIQNIENTYATTDSAAALVATGIQASINDTTSGTSIGSKIASVQQTIADLDSTYSANYDVLISSLADADSSIDANATAVSGLQTYVGVDPNGGLTGAGLLADVEILQKQNDGVIETVADTYDVVLNAQDSNPDTTQLVTTAEPYATWKAADDLAGNENVRLAHIGDVYIKYATTSAGAKEYIASYKFIKTTVDSTSPYATDTEGYTWALIVDQAAQAAFEAALNAHDLADDKRRVFVEQPVGPYEAGDLWIDDSVGHRIVKSAKIGVDRATGYLASDWEVADEQSITFAKEVNPKITTLQNQIDGKIEYLYYDNPTNNPLATVSTGWGEAENGNVVYYKDVDEGYWYSSTLGSFEQLTDTSILKALKSAEDAQAAADNVVVSYYAIKQDTAPAITKFWLNKTGTKVLKEYDGASWVNVAVKEGDTLTAFDPASADLSIYIYYNGAWVTETENGMVASSQAVTDLALDLSNLDSSIYGASGLQQTLEGEINTEGARVESKFVYNSNIAINGETYSSGFGLTSEFIRNNDGTGSKESEFWINADKFKFTNTNNTGVNAPFTIDATGTQPEITFNGRVSFTNVDNNPVAGNVVKFDWYAPSDTLVNIKDQGWTNYSGSGETYLSPAGLKIGNNSGNDQQWLIYNKSIPINPNKRYKVTVEAQQTAGTGTAYFGFAGRNYNDTLWVNSSGANSTSSQYYLISSWDIPTTMTTRESNYWSVGGLVNGSDSSIRTDVVYYRPLILVNYAGEAGITTIKSFKLEELEATVDVSGDISANNDVFAQKLGYANYAAMVNAAASGQTVINGGYINTELIQANAITASQINTEGLIADNISTNTLTGIVLNGARINGAVIKASYLDLNGELEVLTNYIITTSMYSANPSLYSDAVYIEADNEYRIPSVSSVKELSSASSLSAGQTKWGAISAYNIANAGNNLKAVYKRPTFQNTAGDIVVTSATYGGGNSTIYLKLGSITLATIVAAAGYNTGSVTLSSSYTTNVSTNASTASPSASNPSTSAANNVVAYGLPVFGDIKLSITVTSTGGYEAMPDAGWDFVYNGTTTSVTISTLSSSSSLPFDWIGTSKIGVTASNRSATVNLGSIGINNLIAPPA